MKEEYTKIYELKGNLYTKGSPLIIKEGTLLKSEESEKLFVKLVFKNIFDNEVEQIEVELITYGKNNKKLKKSITHRYTDLLVEREEDFDDELIEIEEASLTKFEVIIKEVVYVNDDIWKNKSSSPLTVLPDLKKLDLSGKIDNDYIDDFHKEFGKDIIYIAEKINDLWYCTCGNINSENDKECLNCGRKVDFIDNIDFNKKNEEYKENQDADENNEDDKDNFLKVVGVLFIGVIAIMLFNFINSPKEEEIEYNTLANLVEFSIGGNVFLVELYPDIAPITVSNFKDLVDSEFYDGLTLHRIEKDFVIQGGDPAGNGTGGSDQTIKGEFDANGVTNDLMHEIGVISMARSNEYDSASSQFFICTGDCSFLDGNYAAFGEVVEGLDVVMELNELELVEGTSTPLNIEDATIDYIRIVEE